MMAVQKSVFISAFAVQLQKWPSAYPNLLPMKLDILALASHPDDAEMSCSGTLALHAQMGYRTGIVDFTRGELGTRGTPELRDAEAAEAAKILGLTWRGNLGLPDGFVGTTPDQVIKVIEVLRFAQPEVVLCNAPSDRHPDHGSGAELAIRACFMAGLAKIETHWEGQKQQVWRPKQVFHYIQDQLIKPDFVIDITNHWDTKLASIKAFKSQFYDSSNEGPETYISTPEFWRFLGSRAMEYGHGTGAQYAEGFIKTRQMLVTNLLDLTPKTTLV